MDDYQMACMHVLQVGHTMNATKELLGFDDNSVSIVTLVTLEDLIFKPHRQKIILDLKTMEQTFPTFLFENATF